MKTVISFMFFILGLGLPSHSQDTLKLDGSYQGKDLYVQNPFGGNYQGFCVLKVFVNGKETKDEIQSSAFQIDLADLGLKIGDPLHIRIVHKDGCFPKVLNPYGGKPKCTFEIVAMKVGQDSVLTWKTKNENGKMPFVIEEFRWNKWVKEGEVDGKGSPDTNTYTFKTNPHSGVNTFRVKQVDYSSTPSCFSPSVKYTCTAPPVVLLSKKFSSVLEFSRQTECEIYDQYGNIVKKSWGKNIDCSNLKDGKYSLNYDNTTSEIIKEPLKPSVYSHSWKVSPGENFIEDLHIGADSSFILIRKYDNFSTYERYDGNIKKLNDSTYTLKIRPVVDFGCSMRQSADTMLFTVNGVIDTTTKLDFKFNYSGKDENVSLGDKETKRIAFKKTLLINDARISCGISDPFTHKKIVFYIDERSSAELTFFGGQLATFETTAIMRGNKLLIKKNTDHLYQDMLLQKQK